MISWFVCFCWKQINLFSLVFMLSEMNQTTTNGKVDLNLNIRTGTWMHLEEADKMKNASNYSSTLVANLLEANLSVAKLSEDEDCDQFIGLTCKEMDNPSKDFSLIMYCNYEEGGGFKFLNSCYHLVRVMKTWEEAEQYCIDSYGGHLITVLDKKVDFYLQYLLQSNYDEVWIGIKIQDKFQQKWTSGSYVGYNGFNKTIKDFTEGTCAVRNQRNMWSIVPCSEKYSFICEKVKPKPDPSEYLNDLIKALIGVSTVLLGVAIYCFRSKFADRKKITSTVRIEHSALPEQKNKLSELKTNDEIPCCKNVN